MISSPPEICSSSREDRTVTHSATGKTVTFWSQWLLLLLLSGLTTTCPADPVEVFGYGEFDNLLQTGNEIELLTGTKLRIDLLSASPTGFTLGADFNLQLYSGQTTLNPLDYLPTELTADIPTDVYQLYEATYSNSWELDNCWLKMCFNRWDLTLGKQQLAFGTGYAWNPTDLFNQSDLLDVTYEQPGHQAARLDLATGAIGSWMLVGAPAADLADVTALIQWQQNIGRFEVNLLAARSPWFYTEYTGGLPQARQVARTLYGGSLVGELLGLGVWSEYGWNDLSDNQRFTGFSELVLGTDYTFRNGVYLLGEYLWNGEGKSGSDSYTLTDWLRFFDGETRSLARDQVYGHISYPASDLVSVGLTGLYTVSDGGAAFIPRLYYTPEAETEITLMGQIYTGNKRDQFSEELGAGVRVRFRRYF